MPACNRLQSITFSGCNSVRFTSPWVVVLHSASGRVKDLGEIRRESDLLRGGVCLTELRSPVLPKAILSQLRRLTRTLRIYRVMHRFLKPVLP
jgi:hypothetical protein